MQEPPGLNPKWFEKKVDYSWRNKKHNVRKQGSETFPRIGRRETGH